MITDYCSLLPIRRQIFLRVANDLQHRLAIRRRQVGEPLRLILPG
jgi:hypothetical protein